MQSSVSPRIVDGVISAIRASARATLPERVELHHRFVDDLGFDSLGIVTLVVAIEERFGQPVLLDGWIGSVGSPSALTVESLARWLEETLRDEHGAVPSSA